MERPWTSPTGSSPLSSSVVQLEPFGNVYGKLSNKEKSVITAVQNRLQSSCPNCDSSPYVYKCLSCSKSIWYSAIATDGSGVVNGFFDARDKVDTLVTTNYKISVPPFSRLDIALPISGNEEELPTFCERLRVTIATMQRSSMGRNLAIRFLLARYDSEIAKIPVDELRRVISDLTKLRREDVLILDVRDKMRGRASGIYHLHKATTCTEADCMIVMVHVGHSISPSFLYNAIEFVQSGHSAYFPIVWCEYDPELVQLELEYYSHQGIKLRDPYDHHRGEWSSQDFQAYAISGADRSKLMLGAMEPTVDADETVARFQSGGLNIVRARDHGLVQRFNSKDHSSPEPQMGQALRDLRSKNETAFNFMTGRNRYGGDVFLAVVTSRQNLESRVAAIRESWGQSSNLVPNIHVRYFVGNGTAPESELLRLGGFQDSDELVVMQEVADDEYPPVRKNVNMLKTINQIVQKPEGSLRDANIGYIMKVDDDSYVNFDGILRFLAYHHNSSEAYQFWGERGLGRKKDREGIRSAGLRKPYCLGGPGYILSKQALEAAARGFDDCVNEISRSPHKKAAWHSDVVISICITKVTDVGCFDKEEDYKRNRVFANNYFGNEDFVHRDDLHRIVTMHPFKKSGQMARQYMRFPNVMIAQHKNMVLVSDQVFQNIWSPTSGVGGEGGYNTALTLLFLLIFSVGVFTNRNRILRKVHHN
ncbi:MAG: hypothetical protein SGBAC_007624 [Bacillariaceae sp.]